MSRAIPFTKMVSAGNDFLVVDARRLPSSPWKRVSRALCDRHQGVGADGLLVLEPSAKAHVRMRVFNPDGSEASMCGNGARCVALYLKRPRVTIEAKAGVLFGTVQRDRVAMRLTDPTDIRMVSLRVNGHAVDATSLNTGVPHAVVPVRRLDRVAVNALGRTLRFHRAFAPQGTNVDFIQPSTSANRLRLRTYERGVEAETLACGTGVAASAVAYVLGNPAIGPRPSAVGRMVKQEHSGGRGVAPIGAGVQAPRAVPVGLHGWRGRRQRHRIDVETRGGDRMAVSFTVIPSGRSVAVTDLVLEGRARRICEGIVNWPPRRAA